MNLTLIKSYGVVKQFFYFLFMTDYANKIFYILLKYFICYGVASICDNIKIVRAYMVRNKINIYQLNSIE